MENLLQPSPATSIDFTTVSEPLYVLNRQWEFVFMNEAMGQLMNVNPVDRLGRNIWEVYPHMVGTVLHEHLYKVADTGKPSHFEEYWQPSDCWYEIYIYPITEGFALYVSSINERKQLEQKLQVEHGMLLKPKGVLENIINVAEDKLHKLQELLLETQELAHIGSYEWNATMDKTIGTPQQYKIFGIDLNEEVNMDKIMSIIHPEDREWVGQQVQIAIQNNSVFTGEYRLVMPDGSLKYVWAKSRPVFDDKGTMQKYVGTVMDITERKQAEEELKASQALLLETQELSKVGTFTWDLITDTLKWTDEHYKMFGYEPGVEVTRQMLLDRMHPGDIETISTVLVAAVSKNEPFNLEYRIVLPDGSTKHTWTKAKPIKDENGKVIRYVGSVMDVTDRKQAEDKIKANKEILRNLNRELESKVERRTRELRMSQERLNSITNALPVLISYINREYNYVYVNETYSKWFQQPTGNFIGKKVASYADPGFFEELKTYMDQALAGKPVEFETQLKVAGGIVKTVNARMIPDISEDGTIYGFNALITDITESENAKRSLEHSEERLRLVFESMPQMAWTATADGALNYLNSRWYEYTGQPQVMDEMEGWKYAQHPRDLSEVVEKWQHSVISGEVFEHESRFKRTADATWRWHLTRAVPIQNERNEIIMWVGTCTDIHDQKQLIDQKDEFIGIASHELKTPLTSMKAYVQLMERTLELGQVDTVKGYVQKANVYVDRLTDLISDLLDVSRIQGGRLQFDTSVFDFDSMVRDTVESIQSISPMHRLYVKGNTGKQLTADRQRVEQVLTNLLTNAIKYSPNHTEVEVLIESLPDAVKISVKDQGMGIPKEKQSKVFDRFYRVDNTNKNISGLGIGLFICAEIVKRHKGTIGVESDYGKGAIFHFTIPLTLTEVL
jgi:PAS domain S-box-containing protein